jgi:hypothetical protein
VETGGGVWITPDTTHQRGMEVNFFFFPINLLPFKEQLFGIFCFYILKKKLKKN